MSQAAASTQEELARRHRMALLAVVGVLSFTLALTALALSGVFNAQLDRNPAAEGALRISIVIFGLGAIALRRTKFSAARLQDIASLRGVSGLLETLEKTTVQVALIGGAVAVMGFVIALMTDDVKDKLLGVIAVAVLLYAYPRRAAWERVTRMAQEGGAAPATAAKGTTA